MTTPPQLHEIYYKLNQILDHLTRTDMSMLSNIVEGNTRVAATLGMIQDQLSLIVKLLSKQ